jgi:RHS repeat-associated protein
MKTIFNLHGNHSSKMIKHFRILSLAFLLSAITVLQGWAQPNFTVINTNDSGAGSLRQAIINANSNSDFSNINFAIPTGTAPFIINVNSVLPDIIYKTSINGFTQTGGTTQTIYLKYNYTTASNQLLYLNGTNASNSTIDGLILEGNTTTPYELGINLNSASGCTISNNVFYNTYAGINFNSCNNLTIIKNKFGTDLTGASSASKPNDNAVLGSTGTGLVIGGVGNGNIGGMQIALWSCTGSNIKGNYMGLNSSGNTIIEHGLMTFTNCYNVNIGGSVAGEGNLMAGSYGGGGSTACGIILYTCSTFVYKGNRMGISATGTSLGTNSGGGITCNNSPGNTIGGTAAGEGNVFSNGDAAVIFYNGSDNSIVKGNIFGYDATGTTLATNTWGIQSGSNNNIIGGILAGEANKIAFTGSPSFPFGNLVGGGVQNLVSGNIIYTTNPSHISLKSLLLNSGNNSNPTPVISTTLSSILGNNVTIKGTSSPNNYVEVFLSDNTANAQNAVKFLRKVQADASGNWTASGITLSELQSPILGGYYFVASATDAVNNTSEFTPSTRLVDCSTPIFTGVPDATCLGGPAITLAATPSGGAFAGTGVSGTTFTPSTAGLNAVTYTVSILGCTTLIATKNISVENYSDVTIAQSCSYDPTTRRRWVINHPTHTIPTTFTYSVSNSLDATLVTNSVTTNASGVTYFESQESGTTGFSAKIDFTGLSSSLTPGYLRERGNAYSFQTPLTYGWDVDNTGNNTTSAVALWDLRYDRSIYLKNAGVARTWELAVPHSGTYEVHVICGFNNAAAYSQTNNISVEGTILNDPDPNDDFDDYVVKVSVTDGKITIIGATGAVNANISVVEVNEIITNTISLKACGTQVATATNTGDRCTMTGIDIVCGNATNQTYTVQAPATAIVGSTFSWSVIPGSGASVTGTTNVGSFSTGTQTGPVTLKLIETNANFYGGSATIIKNVYIQPVSVPTITLPVACLPAGGSVTFTGASPTISPYTPTYAWYQDAGGPYSTTTSYTNAYTNTVGTPTSLYGSHTIMLQTMARGICPVSSSVTYIAVPAPVPSFTIADNAVCDGTGVLFTNTSTNLYTQTPATNPKKTLYGNVNQFSLDFGDATTPANTDPTTHTYLNSLTTNAIKNVVLTVYNSPACSVSTGATANQITVYGRPQVAVTASQGASCPSAYDGQITFTCSGGTGPYLVKLRAVGSSTVLASIATAASGTFATSLNVLKAGNYSLEVLDKATGGVTTTESCSNTLTPVTIGFDGMNAAVCAQYGTCSSSTLGTFQLTTSTNGTSPYKPNNYSYSITNKYTGAVAYSAGPIPINASYTTTTATPRVFTTAGFPDGSYTIQITSTMGSNTCTQSFDAILKRPILDAGVSFTPICNASTYTSSVAIAPKLTTGSCTTVSVLSPTLVVKNASGTTISSSGGTSGVTFYTVPPGRYTYTLSEPTDGCSVNGDFNVSPGDPLTINVINVKNARCYNSADGSATAVALGSSNVNYTWYNTSSPSTPLSITGAVATGLAPGTYNVKVTDNISGCNITSSNFTVLNGPALAIQSVVASGTCGSTATLQTGSVGTAPYQYAWTRIVSVTPPVNDTRYVSPAINATTDLASNIIAGNYNVKVTDANGCVSAPFSFIMPDAPLRRYEICVRYRNTQIITDPIPDPTEPTIANPIQMVVSDVAQAFQEKMQKCLTKAESDANVNIKATCEDPTHLNDKLVVTYNLRQYQYTLYKYNRASDLIGTVPPNGVSDLLTNGPIPTDRTTTSSSTLTPYAPYLTTYRYNTLEQLSWQNTPDGGSSEFYYNNRGHLRFSRNARQQTDGTYSYTKYDALNRTIEVGQNNSWATANPNPTTFQTNLNNFAGYPTTGTDRTITEYSNSTTTPTPLINYTFTGTGGTAQRYQRNRVSHVYRENTLTATGTAHSYYSYDPHGNVEWLRQDIPNFASSFVAYEYDLISNKVLKVKYNEGYKDRYFHKYDYDADSRLTTVCTSLNNVTWEKDATYDYYLHGPLRRNVLGQDKVQGVDYTYTIHGWLKGINSPNVYFANDPGNDDGTTVAQDVFGMALTYYKGDFANNTVASNVFNSGASGTSLYKLDPTTERFNGNITAWSSQSYSPALGNGTGLMGNTFTYDRLNRIRSSNFNIFTGMSWPATPTGDYNTSYTYDADGNIKTLLRNGFTSTGGGGPADNKMDNLSYTYDIANKKYNRLLRVDDTGNNNYRALPLNWGDEDVSHVTAGSPEYTYDALGNITVDRRDNVKLTWDVYGKVAMVEPTDNTGTVINPTMSKPKITFTYDASGKRIIKFVQTDPVDFHNNQTYYYMMDANGNTMANYNNCYGNSMNPPGSGSGIKLTEVPIYGTERIGQYIPPGSITATITSYDGTMYTANATRSSSGYTQTDETSLLRYLGYKEYELKDHLGDVSATISDRLIKTASVLNAQLYSYKAYYPFGMTMPGKSYVSTSYRYGFDGKEVDNEIKGAGNSYDFGARIYDPRLGRWLSTDPLAAKYPGWSPYHGMGNSPISIKDPNGKDWFISVSHSSDGRNTTVSITISIAVLNSTGKSNYDELALQDAIAHQIQSSYTFQEGQVVDGKVGTFKVETQVNIRTIVDKKYLAPDEHIIEVLASTDPLAKGLYGKATGGIGGTEIILNEKYIPNIINGTDNNTVPHEIGHTGGLLHIDGMDAFFNDLVPGMNDQHYNENEQKASPDNILYKGGKTTKINDQTSTKVDKKQVETMVDEYMSGNLNKKKK